MVVFALHTGVQVVQQLRGAVEGCVGAGADVFVSRLVEKTAQVAGGSCLVRLLGGGALWWRIAVPVCLAGVSWGALQTDHEVDH
ncbi:hypothetical protein [Streptomyces sp. CMSTAAHL-2]|uniref:hypothetical protein n=1 Tax=Streptomyces sp. CMSTAAHL-2 TaxID=2904522 RepID=UPI001E3A343C|nr:hypothetical protein [Streptomyces sp. CMSTAAHL-2]MCE3029641.1 hypothetical protein [Streptomyces sp. CMSTAAHL-2]